MKFWHELFVWALIGSCVLGLYVVVRQTRAPEIAHLVAPAPEPTNVEILHAPDGALLVICRSATVTAPTK
jgi:hypothetical protein